MITQIGNPKSIKTYFKEINTSKFLKELDNALRSVNLEAVTKLFKDYDIIHLESSQDFIGQLRSQFKSLEEEGVEIILFEKAKPRLSKCIGCSFGSTIKAFTYEYKKRHTYGKRKTEYYDVVYENEFGVLLQIENNVLSDLGVCNAFLTKEECDELKRC